MARPAARIRTDATQSETVRIAREGRQAAPQRQCRGRRRSKPARPRPRAVPQAGGLRLDRRAAQFVNKGASGLGKSWLVCALGHKACRENMSVLYARVPRLFADLAIAHGDARYARLLRSLARVKLLILDDWGPEGSPPIRRAASSKSSRIATTRAHSSSPARFPSTDGMI
jgi:hypothetical protein